MTVSTSWSGQWFEIKGTASEVRAELGRIGAKPNKVISGGNNSGTIVLYVGRA